MGEAGEIREGRSKRPEAGALGNWRGPASSSRKAVWRRSEGSQEGAFQSLLMKGLDVSKSLPLGELGVWGGLRYLWQQGSQ